jgi:hypothetical protein
MDKDFIDVALGQWFWFLKKKRFSLTELFTPAIIYCQCQCNSLRPIVKNQALL